MKNSERQRLRVEAEIIQVMAFGELRDRVTQMRRVGMPLYIKLEGEDEIILDMMRKDTDARWLDELIKEGRLFIDARSAALNMIEE